jgi:6-phosphofructokinase 1
VGVVLEARKYPQVTKIYGAVNGVFGIVNEDFIDLTEESSYNLEQVAMTPSSGLFSTRYKPDENFCKQMFNVLQAHDVRYFFYIGGNDSSDTVRIVNEEAQRANYEMNCIHIPKTIDNDLMINDHCPGYPSAAKFVAQAFMGINLDNKALPGVHICIVMGRHAGFLTAASSFAQIYTDDGPHLIYVPERVFSIDNFLNDVKKVYEKHGRCVVAVAEGVQDEKGQPLLVQLKCAEKDAHGNFQLSGTGALGDLLVQQVKEKLHIEKIRTDTFGYLQRSFVGCSSDVDRHEARKVGEKAVKFALCDNLDGSVTIHRTGDYSVDYRLSDLSEIAAKTKLMPDEFINEEGNHVTEAFKKYLAPLLGSDMPSVSILKSPKVGKIINK